MSRTYCKNLKKEESKNFRRKLSIFILKVSEFFTMILLIFYHIIILEILRKTLIANLTFS